MKKLILLLFVFIGFNLKAQQSDSLLEQISNSKRQIKQMKMELQTLKLTSDKRRNDTLRKLSYKIPIQFQANAIQTFFFGSKYQPNQLAMNSEYAVGLEANIYYILARRVRVGAGLSISRLTMNSGQNIESNSKFFNSDSTHAQMLNTNSKVGMSMSTYSVSLSYLIKWRKFYFEPIIKPSVFLFNYRDDMLFYVQSASSNSYINLSPNKNSVSLALCGGLAVSRGINNFAQIKASLFGDALRGEHNYNMSRYESTGSWKNKVEVASPKYVLQSSVGILFSIPKSIHSDRREYYEAKMQRRMFKRNY